jgi:hypothetical protein
MVYIMTKCFKNVVPHIKTTPLATINWLTQYIPNFLKNIVKIVNNGYKYAFVNNIEYQGLGFITKVGAWQVKWTC